MILSGCHVLFMDPRKEYLGRGRSCYGPISLKHMKKYVNCTVQYIYNFDSITDFSLDTYPHCIAGMAMIVQWMNIMGFDFSMSISC